MYNIIQTLCLGIGIFSTVQFILRLIKNKPYYLDGFGGLIAISFTLWYHLYTHTIWNAYNALNSLFLMFSILSLVMIVIKSFTGNYRSINLYVLMLSICFAVYDYMIISQI